MLKLKISNPNLSGEEKTFLTSDYSTGTSLSVRNSDNFTTNWFVVVGEPGQERTELKTTSALPSSTAITISGALSFSHPKSTPVYRSHYNQVSLERKPTGGSYSEVAKYNIEWDNDDRKTFIAVSAGTSTDTYKWRFYNSNSGEYTDYSDELAGTGVARTQAGHVIELVRKNPITQNVDDETLLIYASDFQEIVYDQVPKAWWFQKQGTEVDTVASDYTYPVTSNWSDFLSMKFVLYHYTVSGTDIDETYPLTYSPLNEFYNYKSDSNQATDDAVKWWTVLPPDSDSADGYLGLHPTPKTANCGIIPVYQFELSALDSFGDTLVIPYQKGYVDYILYRIFDDIKNDSTNAQKYNSRVGADIIALKRRARRNLGQPELFRWRGQKGWSRMYGDNAQGDWQLHKETYY